MDLLGIMLDSALEGVVHGINIFLDILNYVFVLSSSFGMGELFKNYISPLYSYIFDIAYTVLGTLVLVVILKQLITDDEISTTQNAVQLIAAGIAIAASSPILVFMREKSVVIVNEMTALVKVSVPDVSGVDFSTVAVAITALSPLVKVFALFLFGVGALALIGVLILFLISAYYEGLLLIAEAVSPLMGLGALKNDFGIFGLFLRDVLGIYIIRIMQLVLLKLSFTIIAGSVVKGLEVILTSDASELLTIPAAYIEISLNLLMGIVFIIVLIFIPVYAKKYVNIGPGAGKNMAMTGASILKGLM